MIRPKLSIYVGESQISALRYNSPDDYKFYAYPYVPLDALTHNYSYKNRPAFVNQVIKKVFSDEVKLDPENFDLIVGDVGGGRTFGDKKEHIGIGSALNSIHNFSWLMVENFTVVTPSDFVSYFPFSEFKNDEEFINYFSNKSLYPQVVPGDREGYDREERLLNSISSQIKHKYKLDTPIVLTGGKFFNANKNPGYMYVSALEFLKEPGVYEVKIDTQNKLPVIGLLNQSFGDTTGEDTAKVGMLTADILDDSQFYNEFIDVGTVLRSQGRAECLFEKEGSSPQFVEVDKNKIFILPLEKNEIARVSISTGKLGKIEKNIKGGDIGFIIDTRTEDNNRLNPEWVAVFEERLASF